MLLHDITVNPKIYGRIILIYASGYLISNPTSRLSRSLLAPFGSFEGSAQLIVMIIYGDSYCPS